MQPEQLDIDQLLLDPNNYRLQEQEDFASIAEERYHLERVQNGTFQRLKKEDLKSLRDSIVSNGYLEIERIVVTPYDYEEGKYLVIEGNRRLAALLQIRDEYEAGVDIPKNVIDVLEKIPCLVATGSPSEAFFREAIMGIRHVGGIREWGGYQRAKLIADLRDGHNLEASDISQKLGLSVQEVNRRYRAYKALEQMQEDETYGEFASASLYAHFHEAVALPIVREWLDWDSNTNTFSNDAHREIFYQLLSPRENDEGQASPPKLKTYSEVRELKKILPNLEARADLIQMDREFLSALTIAAQSEMTQRWRNEVSEAQTALSNIPALDIGTFEPDDLKIIQDLINTAQHIIDFYEKTKD